MGSEWRGVQLGEVASFSSGGTPKSGVAEYWDGDIPWISASSMKSVFLSASDRTLTAQGLEAGSRLAEEGSVLLLVRGSELHKRIPIGVATRSVAFNQDVKALQARDGMTQDFLLYWLLGNEQSLLAKVENTGIGAGKLDTTVLKNLQVYLPELPEQRAIAHILGTLDDKIELNRRMNETLEGMARALFKSWFVDFDPVRAKMDGRWQPGESLPGLPADLYDLFPDRLVETELGEAPEGWEVRPLDTIADFVNGAACQKFAPEEAERTLPVIKIRELKGGITSATERVRLDVPEKHRAYDGDVLFSWSGSLVCDLWTGGDAFVNQHVFKVTSSEYPRWLYLYWTKHHLDEFQAIAEAKATTMGHIKRSHLAQARTVLPGPSVLPRLSRFLEPLVTRQVALRSESSVRADLRDTLLPKLISGELRVPDAEQIVARAT